VIKERQLLEDLRALGQTRAPTSILTTVLSRLELGDEYALLDTLLGPLFVAWNTTGISAVMRTPSGEAFEERFVQRFGRSIRTAREVPCDLGDKFDLRGLTEFERAVLLKAREIPRGEIRTYGWIASEIGHPAAVRAVGSALRKNPVPVFIPCHRVVRSDGQLGQYALGGTDQKRAILSAEGVEPDELEQLARAGVRYIGNAATGAFCFPTCSRLRLAAANQRVPFKSDSAARAAGYRPCSACRPAARSA
jgi:O-6-methylguanine DNA methyltransferase